MHTNIWKSTTAPNATDCGSGYTNLIWYNTTNNQAYRYNATTGLWTLWITGSGGGVVEITYADLNTLYTAGSLTPGQWYLITDYRTIYKQPDSGTLMGRSSANSGVNPSMIYKLLVLATGASAIAHEAYVVSVLNDDGTQNTTYTPLCSQWKVWYNINNDTSLYSWASSSGMGVIYRLIDHKGNDLPYDFYNVRFRVYAPNYATYTTYAIVNKILTTTSHNLETWSSANASSYALKTIVLDNTNQLYIRLRNNNTNQPSTVTDNIECDWKMFLSNTSLYIPQDGIVMCYDGNSYATIGIDSTKYADLLTFNGSNYYENKMEANYDSKKIRLYTNVFMSDTYKNHFGYGCRDNMFYGSVYENEISDGFRGNYIVGDFYQNNIGVGFGYNTLLNTPFYGNTVGTKCIRNHMGGESGVRATANQVVYNQINYNQIGNNFNCNAIFYNFSNNVIGNSFNSNFLDITFKYNRIASNFYFNNVGQNFQYNSLESDFHDNVIGCCFVNNQIGSDFYSNKIGKDMKRNVIGNRCVRNQIGDDCKVNTIGSSFEDSTIKNNFSACILGHCISLYTDADNFQFVNIPTLATGDDSNEGDDTAAQGSCSQSISLPTASYSMIYGKHYTINIVVNSSGNYKAFCYTTTGAQTIQTFIF
jgi:hypothetical protein